MADVDGLYVLVDGTHAAPKDVSRGDDGIMRHKVSGMAVAMYEDGTPQTVGRDAVANKNVEAAQMAHDTVAGAAAPSEPVPAPSAPAPAPAAAPTRREAPPPAEEPKPAARSTKAD